MHFHDSTASVVFRNVGFSYAAESRPALEDISFAIRSNTTVGVHGPDGSGKSTLVRLLARCIVPTSGTISLQGEDLKRYSIAESRNIVSFVPRHPLLFSGTIGDNIAYSRLRANKEEIAAAADAINIHHLIEANPRGYGAHIGDRGCLLTGSQRQLIALAREYLKNPLLLVIDDPMAMHVEGLDNDVLRAIKTLCRNRTTFIASRELTTLAHCDLILNIEHGRLASVNADVEAASHVRNRRAVSF